MRAIGRWSLVALIVNSVIGAGVFGLPQSIAVSLGSYAPLGYLAGAVMTACVVAVVAELGSQVGEAGGAYCYVRDAFGGFWGLQVGCFSWLSRISTASAISHLLISHVSDWAEGIATPVGRSVCLICIISVLVVVNCYGIRAGVSLSTLFAFIKTSILTSVILCGALYLLLNQRGVLADNLPKMADWLDAMVAMVFAYSGFESALIPGSELKNPRKDVPIAVFVALAMIACIYSMLHVVIMFLLPDLASTERPVNAAAAVLFGPAGGAAMSVAAILSMVGWLSAAAVTAPRLTYAMALKGDIPRYFSRILHRHETPWVSIAFWGILVAGLGIYGGFKWNVTLSVAARVVVYSAMCLSAVALRYKHPTRDAWRMPLGWTIPLIGVVVCLAISTRFDYDHFAIMALVCTMGCVIWIANNREIAQTRL